MKRIRWSAHARKKIDSREIDSAEVENALATPNAVVTSASGREIYMRVYNDSVLSQRMLLRVVIEESDEELAVVTVYKTSKIDKYL